MSEARPALNTIWRRNPCAFCQATSGDHVGGDHAVGHLGVDAVALGVAGAVLAGGAVVDAVPHGVAVEDVVDLHREVVALVAEVHAAGGPGDDAVRQLLELRQHRVERRGDHELVDAARLVLADDRARARRRRDRRGDQGGERGASRHGGWREGRGHVGVAPRGERHRAVQVAPTAGATRRGDGGGGAAEVAGEAGVGCVLEADVRVGERIGVDLADAEGDLVLVDSRQLSSGQRPAHLVWQDHAFVECLVAIGEECGRDRGASRAREGHRRVGHAFSRELGGERRHRGAPVVDHEDS